MTEGKKASKVRKSRPPPSPPLAQGLDPPLITALPCVFCVATFLILIMKYEEGRNHNSIKLLSVHLTENVCVLSTFPVDLWISEIHDYNLRGSNYDLQLPLPKTNFLKRSFSYRGAMAWNQLSNETREMGDLTSFKIAIS